MIYQINTDHNLTVSPEYAEKIKEIINHQVERFGEHITRLEVFLSDQNADKDTGADKHCNIEARLKGESPIVASADGDTYDKAISSAATKLKKLLDTKMSKARGY